MTLEEVAGRFQNVRRVGANISARCPAHDDNTNSLALSNGHKGGVVLNCFAGCDSADILEAVGLTFKDVSPNGNGHAGGPFTIVNEYDYTDETGALLYQSCRLSPKDFRFRRPDGYGRWIWKLEKTRRVLYRLPELMKADPETVVHVVEGEKDVDRLRAAGLIATTNPGGAGKWKPAFNRFLKDRHVVIIPDNDEPGLRHAEDIASNLRSITATVKIVNLPGVGVKGDVSDWLKAGHTTDELRALAEAAPTWTPPSVTAGADVPSFPRTDAGNAELFASLYGDRLRFDHRRGRWLMFEKGAHRWRPDCEAGIRKLAVEAARNRFERAAGIGDTAERKAEAVHAIASESRQKVEAMLYFAQALPPISDPGMDWDLEPMVLGAPNGVIDLKDGTLRPGCPADRITMTTGVPFEPHGKAPRWKQFLFEVFEDNELLIDWHHRAVGYSATGDTSEQIVITKHGRGGEGKSVHDRAIAGPLGDYAHNVAFAMFEHHARASIPSDLAELPGKRFVTASETNEGARLNEARIKALTGGDIITCRHLFQREFQFRPVLKLWLSVNHLPRVTDDSYGFWRRVRIIPFRRQFKGTEADKDLSAKLQDEAAGILSWLVRGAVAWRKHGLDRLPEDVTTATRAYQDESDPLADFRLERCEEDQEAETASTDLYRSYQAWADNASLGQRERLTLNAFGRRMGARYVGRKTEHGKVYIGVKVKHG